MSAQDEGGTLVLGAIQRALSLAASDDAIAAALPYASRVTLKLADDGTITVRVGSASYVATVTSLESGDTLAAPPGPGDAVLR